KNLAPAGTDPDIILNRSTDGGQTWSSGIRVNQDPLNDGKIQYIPAVQVDKTGGLNVIFYDDRNTTSDSTGVFLARSEDGGNNWKEFEISDKNFKPQPLGGLGQGYQGDNISITSSNGKLWPVWMDNRTGTYQIWTVPIELSLVNVDEFSGTVSDFRLEQNYPNPFNPRTTIKFHIAEFGYIRLSVYDVLGNEVAILVDEVKDAGSYEIEFSAKGGSAPGGNAYSLSSGIYFYKLNAENFSDTKKLILLK
ncbi:MAG TPA: T9SS type A sorting domain-containing protein, partial [Ignavibacteriaceae bacterium]